MEEQQPVPLVDTPPPSPSSKRLKLASSTAATIQDLRINAGLAEDPHSLQPQQHNSPHQQCPAPSLENADKHDLPEDFLEPLDINLNEENSTFPSSVASFQIPSLQAHSPHLCDAAPLSASAPQQLQRNSQYFQNAAHPQHLPNVKTALAVPLASSAEYVDLHSMYPTSVSPLLSLPPPDGPHLRGRLSHPVSPSPHKEVSSTCTLDASSHQRGCRQFWKAGDYEADRPLVPPMFPPGGIDHVRVHPKFLHSNATSHKWALGAVAELLDNALDEVSNGATFVKLDMIRSPQDRGPMLLFEDDGGGMNPDCLRHCMSLGYSVKSKLANTIGQYGNGFKTSTMRLGSDVLVLTRFPSRAGGSPTQSIGLLSFTFLRDTRQEDIIVPMVDYEIEPLGLRKSIRSTVEDWDCNMATITKWSPYHSEPELLDQFNSMKLQGTKIILYNLWEDDEGNLELDFDADPYDIQVRGANRDEKKTAMAAQYPNSRHYLTYRYSLRSYASILYLRLPSGFQIILRGKEVEHHPLVNDMMFIQERKYKPHSGGDTVLRDTNMMAVVTIGFVKDAKEHIDVQGFNVYHKNRLIKPFWRIWNAASSQGRGIIAVLEANFVEPAHDKQGFERTIVLSRLEARLLQMQKAYWSNYSHMVGYAKKDTPRVHYPARSILRSEALLPGDRIVTRSSLSMHDPSLSLQSSTPETYLMARVVQEDDLSTIPISGKNNVVKDGIKNVQTQGNGEYIEVDSAISLDVAQISPQGFDSSPVNRTKVADIRLLIEVKKNEKLESKVLRLQKAVQNLKDSIEGVVKERDLLRSQIGEQARRQATKEAELRLKLEAAYLRIEQLERSSCLGAS